MLTSALAVIAIIPMKAKAQASARLQVLIVQFS
jgi:hypothetical protein